MGSPKQSQLPGRVRGLNSFLIHEIFLDKILLREYNKIIPYNVRYNIRQTNIIHSIQPPSLEQSDRSGEVNLESTEFAISANKVRKNYSCQSGQVSTDLISPCDQERCVGCWPQRRWENHGVKILSTLLTSTTVKRAWLDLM